MKKHYFFILFLTLSSFIYAQNTDNPRLDRKLGVSAELGGVLYASFVVDYFIHPKLQVELNLLPIERKEMFSLGGGVKYHPWGDQAGRKWSPYIGFKAGYVEVNFVNKQELVNFYVPIGVNTTSTKGFDFSVDVGFFHERNQGDFESRIHNSLRAGVKLGYRFKL